MATACYSQPAAANYYTSPPHAHKTRGYRICDTCGAVETPNAKFRLCGGCLTTQYCSPDCQKNHWPAHKIICQHTASTVSNASCASDENLAKNLRKFTSAYTQLLGWAGFQALQLKKVPANIRQNALLIDLGCVNGNHSDAHRRFSILNARIVSRSFVTDPLVTSDIQRREDRCRQNGGIGTLIVILQCNGISQVMPVEVDPPAKITWDVREDWLKVLIDFVENGRLDFLPISSSAKGVHYGY